MKDIKTIKVDFNEYCNRLWTIAYEGGKAEEHIWWSEHCANCTDGDRPQGEWIDDGSYYYWRCSNCNGLSCCRSKFCGDCGARMKGTDDE